MKRPVWSKRAERELDALVAYYAQFGGTLADLFIDRAERASAQLVEHPRLGPELPDSRMRKWRVTGTPFLLLYRPIGRGVRILRVRDARSDWRSEGE